MVPWISKIELKELDKKEEKLLFELKKHRFYIILQELCLSKNINMITSIEEDKTGFTSSLSIIFLDGSDNMIKEPDEPNCSIFIYETIFFKGNKKYYFVDLINDPDFLNQLLNITNLIKKI